MRRSAIGSLGLWRGVDDAQTIGVPSRDAFDARNWFASKVTPFRLNQFGASGGGPIKKDKAFIFLSYQGFHLKDQFPSQDALPTAAQIADATSCVTTGINPNLPLLNANDFYVPTIPAETPGVPCGIVNGVQTCDTFETAFGATGRNTFRGPFQERFDASAVKVTKINERMTLKFQADILNAFNHPSFDVPTNTATQYSVTNGVPSVRALRLPTGVRRFGSGLAKIVA